MLVGTDTGSNEIDCGVDPLPALLVRVLLRRCGGADGSGGEQPGIRRYRTPQAQQAGPAVLRP